MTLRELTPIPDPNPELTPIPPTDSKGWRPRRRERVSAMRREVPECMEEMCLWDDLKIGGKAGDILYIVRNTPDLLGRHVGE